MTQFLPIILLMIIPIGIFMYMKNKKKKQREGNGTTGNRKSRKDEVWSIVKKFLKEQNEVGKEIVQLFPAKKKDETDTSIMNKQEKKEFKVKEKEIKLLKKTDHSKYKAIKKAKKDAIKNKQPEIWFLYFQTWNSKSKIIDEPRILEVEVKYIKINKKKTDRKVFVKGLADFEKEMKWISPLKDKEDQVIEKQKKINDNKVSKKNKHELSKKNKNKKSATTKQNPILNKFKKKKIN